MHTEAHTEAVYQTERTSALELLEAIAGKVKKRTDVVLKQYGKIATPQQTFPLYTISSIGDFDIAMVLTAGFHGDEICGPLTIMHHLDEIVETAHQAGVGLYVYPCVNPSGFDARTRYNHLNQQPNNYALVYLRTDGTWTDDLLSETRFKKWLWADETSDDSNGNRIVLQDETTALLRDFRTIPWKIVRASLDIHQDRFSAEYGKHCTYAYCFGNKRRYVEIIAELPRDVPILRHKHIDEGYSQETDDQGNVVRVHRIPKTNSFGLVEKHDYSITALAHYLGVEHAVALETTTNIPLDKCYQVNMTWIKGLLRLS